MILLMEEIRRSPVEVGSLLPIFCKGFFHIPGGYIAGFLVAINSITPRRCRKWFLVTKITSEWFLNLELDETRNSPPTFTRSGQWNVHRL